MSTFGVDVCSSLVLLVTELRGFGGSRFGAVVIPSFSLRISLTIISILYTPSLRCSLRQYWNFGELVSLFYSHEHEHLTIFIPT